MSSNAQPNTQGTPLERALGRSSGLQNTKELHKKSRIGEEIIRVLLLFSGIVSIFTTLGIVFVLGNESRLFLNAEAWLPVKAPLISEGAPTFTLEAAITVDDDFIPIAFTTDRERRAYIAGNFMQVDDEIMLIETRTDAGVTVIRGEHHSEARPHQAGVTINAMEEVQVRTQSAMSSSPEDANPDENVLWDEILLEAWMLEEFEVGQRIRVGNSSETLVITDKTETSLVVDRGTEDLAPQPHADDEQLSLADKVRLTEFFTNTRWSPTLGEFGVAPLVSATLMTSFMAMLVAIPFGLGAAIYLSEYARPELRSTLKPILEILAGVPTVVYGYFAIQAMTPFLQWVTPDGTVGVYNMASAGLVMGIMILPTISSMSEDALSAVPRALREASYGLGSTRFETTIKVVIPAALSGILAAFIVGISRAVGETMIVAIAAGGKPNFTVNPFADAETMTGHIVRISKGDLSYNSVEYNSIFAIGITLFVITLTLNLISGWIVRRFREAY